MFIDVWITRLAPWLIGVGGLLGIVLAAVLLYLRRHPEDPGGSDRVDPPS
ncbi:hypothetical protein [Acidithiobacillus acidisediminis]|nr:hypothetical protein [Acidithiobacillus sp. S30A2]